MTQELADQRGPVEGGATKECTRFVLCFLLALCLFVTSGFSADDGPSSGVDPNVAPSRSHVPAPVFASDRAFPINGNAASVSAPESSSNSKHRALVVGCDYAGTELASSSGAKDAQKIGAMLKDTLGFEVVLKLNPSRSELLEAMDELCDALERQTGVGLFYFSGRGTSHGGEDFLIPFGADIKLQRDLPGEGVTVQMMVTQMESAHMGFNLLLIDTSRDSSLPGPGMGETRSEPSANARLTVPSVPGTIHDGGTIVGFAADVGASAFDTGEGSYYTNSLLRHLPTPGISVLDALMRVRREVKEIVARQQGALQRPCIYLGVDEFFSLAPPL